MPKSTVQVATAFFIPLLTSTIFAEVYVYKDNDGKLIFRNVPAETVIDRAHWNKTILSARQWEWKQDINGDGKVTISDVDGWVKWLFFYPGDSLIHVLLKKNVEAAGFFELTPASYGGS